MKPYLLSLGAGLVVGIVYHLLTVRSPAPPVIALIGLFGMLLGEQVIPVAKRIVGGWNELTVVARPSAQPGADSRPSDQTGENPGRQPDARRLLE